MPQPIEVDIPHKLERQALRARLDGGVARLAGLFPGGSVTDHRWDGDTMFFTLTAMGQRVASRLELRDTHVHAVLDVPPFLAMFADRIRAKLQKEGPALLK